MATVTVTYHHEDEGWWAEADTDEVPRFSAAGETYDETHALVVRSLTNILGASEIDIREQLFDEELGVAVPLTLTKQTLSGSFLSSIFSGPRTWASRVVDDRNVTSGLTTHIAGAIGAVKLSR